MPSLTLTRSTAVSHCSWNATHNSDRERQIGKQHFCNRQGLESWTSGLWNQNATITPRGSTLHKSTIIYLTWLMNPLRGIQGQPLKSITSALRKQILCTRLPWELHKLSFVAYGKFLSYSIMLRLTQRRRHKNSYMNKETNNSNNGESYLNDNHGDDKIIIKKKLWLIYW